MINGTKVKTPFGKGIVTGVDLPISDLKRYVVRITEPTKSHFLIEHGKPLCFFPKEISVCTD